MFLLGDLIFVDFNTLLNDQSETMLEVRWLQPDWYKNFRQGVLQRDEFCVITRQYAELCDAAHIIPRYEGDEVMFMVTPCYPSMTIYSSTSRRSSKIVLPFMAVYHLQFLTLMPLRMESCCLGLCMHCSVREMLPS